MFTANEDFQGVSNCYVFKSRLQEYAQKAGLPTPVYETIKDGPSHEPYFRSTVIVNDVRYDSLPGFFNRKAAEQSAAEVALMELAKSGEVNQSITQPVHETGLCKNLLQEYAQKMNYAMPTYQCKKDDTPPGRAPLFSCTVDIGGILYIGGTTKTKKEAEIKAARTALLAIQTNASQASQNQFGHLTVIPSRKRATDSVPDEASKAPKPKKARFKRKFPKRKQSRDKKPRVQTDNAGDGANINQGIESLASANDESGNQEAKSEAMFPSEAVKDSENGASTNHEKETTIHPDKEMLAGDGSFALNNQEVFDNGKSTEFQSKEVNLENVVTEVSFAPNGDILAKSDGMFVPNGSIPANRDIPAKSAEMFAPNGDLPAKSAEMLVPNGDLPAKSAEMFVSSGDIPAKGAEMLVPNRDIPAKSAEMLVPSGDIPAKSAEMLVPSGDIPAKSTEMFVSNGDLPAKSAEMLVPNGDIPAKSAEMLVSSGDIPAKSAEMLVPNGDIPAKSAEMFVSSGDISAKSAEMFVPNRDIPSKSAEMFVPNEDIPAKIAEMFVPNRDISAKSVEMNEQHHNGDMVSDN